MTKPRLLCIDDEPDILEALHRLLKDDWQLTLTHDASQAMEHLAQEKAYDVILTDYRMPYYTGLDIFKQARAHQPLCARCLLTGQMDLQAAAEGINTGLIHKLILKPWDNEHLKLQLDEARKLHHILRERSLDSMTGLPNHRYFQEYSAQLFEASDDKGFSMIIFDVDHFKSYNDQYGHVAGDKLLIAIARILRENLDPKYFLARYGGEEFIALLPNTQLSKAFDIAETIRKALEKESFIGVLPRASFVNVSAGVAEYPRHGGHLSALMESADKALYAAKNAGRNQSQKAN